MAGSNTPPQRAKITVLGGPGTGKSSLILNLAENRTLMDDSHPLILESQIRTVHAEGMDFKFEMYDTQSNSSFYNNLSFISSSTIIFVLFDITNDSSFKTAKTLINSVKTQANDKNIILIGTKSDLQDKRVVAMTDAIEYAKEQGIGYTEVSARYENDQLLKQMATHVLIPSVTSKAPPTSINNESEQLNRDKVESIKKQLQSYIKRISSHTRKDGNINYEAGFWFFAKSRAANREANYLLAQKLLDELEHGNTSKSLFTKANLSTTREHIIGRNGIFNREGYVNRGINSSELNQIISSALKP
ncbi:hypothetical protein [Legionella bononiensis]|uniref:hypothetical protein n=1 Tax=Legionella bononiensis TaxID=2793102 RepID=UPI001934A934|nr:hypothetical protein [Legionella bononiensis]MBL7480601.1 hypothetical protein [Legionella bononiensis]